MLEKIKKLLIFNNVKGNYIGQVTLDIKAGLPHDRKSRRSFAMTGFTLAEVLVTLSILGVVAAISIPNLIQNYQKQLTVSRLKMAYSILDNLTQRSYIENGYPLSYGLEIDIFNNFHKYFGKYLSISKDCGNFTAPNHIKNNFCFKNNSFKTLSGITPNEGGYSPAYFYQVLLKNGMGLGVWSNYDTYHNGIIFVVDLDGPNRGDSKLGQDVFMFTYSGRCNNGVGTLLMGGVSASTCSSPSKNTALNTCKPEGSRINAVLQLGSTCSTLIIKDGWKISSDYPWTYARKKL